ncbi:MAG: TraB/GumN family protein [Planctomycetota bacterium]
MGHRRSTEPRRPATATVLAVLAVLAGPAASQEAGEPPSNAPLLWRLQTYPASFVLGTIHVADQRVLALPPQVQDALDQADVVHGETALTPDEDVAHLLVTNDEIPLRHRIPRRLYERLDTYVKAKGASMVPLDTLWPWAVAMHITVLDRPLQPALGAAPLDQHVLDLALAAGKRTGALESVEEQIGVFVHLQTEEHTQLLANTLDVLERLDREQRSATDELVTLYLGGDETRLREHALRFLPREGSLHDKIVGELLQRRNQRLAGRIEATIRSHRGISHLFAIGAAHLGGPTGVLQRLRDRGVRLRRVTGGAAGRSVSRDGE